MRKFVIKIVVLLIGICVAPEPEVQKAKIIVYGHTIAWIVDPTGKIFLLPPEQMQAELESDPEKYLKFPEHDEDWHQNNIAAHTVLVDKIMVHGGNLGVLQTMKLEYSLSDFYKDPQGKVASFIYNLQRDRNKDYRVYPRFFIMLHDREEGGSTEFLPGYVPYGPSLESVKIFGVEKTEDLVRFIKPLTRLIKPMNISESIRKLSIEPTTFMALPVSINVSDAFQYLVSAWGKPYIGVEYVHTSRSSPQCNTFEHDLKRILVFQGCFTLGSVTLSHLTLEHVFDSPTQIQTYLHLSPKKANSSVVLKYINDASWSDLQKQCHLLACVFFWLSKKFYISPNVENPISLERGLRRGLDVSKIISSPAMHNGRRCFFSIDACYAFFRLMEKACAGEEGCQALVEQITPLFEKLRLRREFEQYPEFLGMVDKATRARQHVVQKAGRRP